MLGLFSFEVRIHYHSVDQQPLMYSSAELEFQPPESTELPCKVMLLGQYLGETTGMQTKSATREESGTFDRGQTCRKCEGVFSIPVESLIGAVFPTAPGSITPLGVAVHRRTWYAGFRYTT